MACPPLSIPQLELDRAVYSQPDLFCSAIDWLMDMLSHSCPDSIGIEVAGSHFTDMDYADDAVLLTSDPRNWGNVLGCYEDSTSSVSGSGLHTNWLKTKIQNIGVGSAPKIVFVAEMNRSPDAAERRCDRPAIELTGIHYLDRYEGADP